MRPLLDWNLLESRILFVDGELDGIDLDQPFIADFERRRGGLIAFGVTDLRADGIPLALQSAGASVQRVSELTVLNGEFPALVDMLGDAVPRGVLGLS
ncbi:hypothetical protein [Nocardia sp. R6R-6]|uniref:hypothetical protein n=1 Tax=Nocardia sp. R6R-6 TaxID=3459303 RepID=UPI00403DF570